MKVEIVKFDNLGRGIGYIDNKIIFVPKTVPGDIVEVTYKINKKNYIEGCLKKIIVPSKMRKEALCPFFSFCGGCDLMHISLSNALEYKLNKVNEIFKKNGILYEIKEIVKSSKEYNYRNKVTLKIKDDLIGYYSSSSHEFVEIDYCYLIKDSLNLLMKDLKILGIHNGEVTLRVNYKDELLIIITTSDKIINTQKIVNKHKIVGIICNDEIIYGEDYFIDSINDYLFKVSYNSFFQVNPFISSELFELISEYTKKSKNVIDLYCGVGTLSIAANGEHVLGVEIIDNAIKDANLNKIFNHKDNLEFVCDDTKNILDKITNEFDTLILDPPRNGVNKQVIDKILEVKPDKIIYISCNPITLARDLLYLKESYDISEVKLLDMFVNTEHVECCALLNLKENLRLY